MQIYLETEFQIQYLETPFENKIGRLFFIPFYYCRYYGSNEKKNPTY